MLLLLLLVLILKWSRLKFRLCVDAIMVMVIIDNVGSDDDNDDH